MGIKPKYKLILFDGDDTLYRIRGSIGQIYSNELTNFGHAISPAEIDRVLPSVWKEFEPSYLNRAANYVTSHSEEEQRWYQFVQMMLESLKVEIDSSAYFKAVYPRFGRGDSRELLPDSIKILTDLRTKGYRTGLLTNNDRRIEQLVVELGLNDLLDHIFISADLGFKKPSAECFSVAARRAQVSADEILYVGDSLELDYFAAKAAGWHALWLNWKNKQQPEGVSVIKKLSDLQALL